MPNDASVIKRMPFEPPSFSPRTKLAPSDRRGLIERRALQGERPIGVWASRMMLIMLDVRHDEHHVKCQEPHAQVR
jgi:hypothetical protein